MVFSIRIHIGLFNKVLIRNQALLFLLRYQLCACEEQTLTLAFPTSKSSYLILCSAPTSIPNSLVILFILFRQLVRARSTSDSMSPTSYMDHLVRPKPQGHLIRPRVHKLNVYINSAWNSLLLLIATLV